MQAFDSDTCRELTDREVVATLAAAGRLLRSAEAVLVDATAHVMDRSDVGVAEKLTTAFGCRSVNELLQRTTRGSKVSASDLIRAARVTRRPVAPSSGEVLPAELPRMRDALGAGAVGVDGVVAVAVALAGCPGGMVGVLAADEELAACSRGEGADAAPPPCADELRQMACVWAMFLDQDGAEPRETRALRRRGITVGPCVDGLPTVRGHVLPEVAGQLRLGFDSVLNPKVEVVPVVGVPVLTTTDVDAEEPSPDEADRRSRAQKQHDALAMILAVATRSLPTLGGAAPTLVVSVREEDLASGRGSAHIGGCDEPVSLRVARHVACAGAVQKVVFDAAGRIVQLGNLERAFTSHQRRAIGLRDGGCLIPGCHVAATWCEIHHVQEHAQGGPTHIDNGVMLCFFHHRTLDTSGWAVRMNHGVPEVRGPAWWDRRQIWRPVTASPTRLRERLTHRT